MSECFLCLRIDADVFYKELRELGFESEEAKTITSWIPAIYASDATFLCGFSSRSIKAALAYIGAKVFGKGGGKWNRNEWGFFEKKYSQRNIAEKFDITEVALRENYQRINKFMLKNIPEAL